MVIIIIIIIIDISIALIQIYSKPLNKRKL